MFVCEHLSDIYSPACFFREGPLLNSRADQLSYNPGIHPILPFLVCPFPRNKIVDRHLWFKVCARVWTQIPMLYWQRAWPLVLYPRFLAVSTTVSASQLRAKFKDIDHEGDPLKWVSPYIDFSQWHSDSGKKSSFFFFFFRAVIQSFILYHTIRILSVCLICVYETKFIRMWK